MCGVAPPYRHSMQNRIVTPNTVSNNYYRPDKDVIMWLRVMTQLQHNLKPRKPLLSVNYTKGIKSQTKDWQVSLELVELIKM